MHQPLPGVLPFRLLLTLALVVITQLATAPGDSLPPWQFNDKLEHLLAFYGLALLADFSFRGSGFGLGKILPLLGYGLLIELIQRFIPYRNFSPWDLGADVLGLAAYAASIPLLRRAPVLAGRWS
jgi:VanZ family protein